MDELAPKIVRLLDDKNLSDVGILREIRKLVQSTEKPDFSKIYDGNRFVYFGIDWIRLGLEQDGILCITANAIDMQRFSTRNCSNWKESEIREMLNTEFLQRLNECDLLDYESDLTADNGDPEYGTCKDKIGLISLPLYRKYRKYIPNYEEWMWTCTPWSSNRDYDNVIAIDCDGRTDRCDTDNSNGYAPVCIFRP